MQTSPEALALFPALVALLETESVTEAAARLGVGQPAMSRTLARLRELFGDPLLVRVGRRVQRTRRADELLPQALETLALASRTLTRPERFDPRTAEGVLTFALGDDLAAMLLGPLLLSLRREAPGLDLRVRPLGRGSLDEARRGLVDLAITPDLGPAGGMPDLSDFVKKPIYTRRFVTVAKTKRRLTLDAFCAAEHLLVSPSGDATGYVDTALAALGRERRIAVTVPSFQAALALVQRTDLLATLPDDIVGALAPKLPTMTCPVTTPELPMCLVYHARHRADPRHRWMRERVERGMRGD